MINVGNRNFFFEIGRTSIESKKLLPVRINIQGNVIGTLKSPTYLPSFIYSFECILESDHYFISNMTVDELENIIKSNEKDIFLNPYKVTLEETFDDFFKVFIRTEDSVLIYIKRYDHPFFDDTNILPNLEFFTVIPLRDFIETLSSFKDYVA